MVPPVKLLETYPDLLLLLPAYFQFYFQPKVEMKALSIS